MHSIDRAQVGFGILVLIIGVGTGYLMYTHPEGLNPYWPLGMAMLVPAVFTFAGLHVIAAGLGQTRLSIVMLRAILLGLGVIINWAAFFTKNMECVVTVSFLGLPVLGWRPTEEECRASMRATVAVLDVLVLVLFGVFLWQRRRTLRNEPGT